MPHLKSASLSVKKSCRFLTSSCLHHTVIESKRSSISCIQRRLRIGYNKVAMLMETMEKYGIVSTPVNNSRRILVGSIEEAKTRLPICDC